MIRNILKGFNSTHILGTGRSQCLNSRDRWDMGHVIHFLFSLRQIYVWSNSQAAHLLAKPVLEF